MESITKYDNAWLLQELKKENKRNGGSQSIGLPSRIEFKYDKDTKTVHMVMGKGITKNMQDNEAAFEGWALAIKANLEEIVDKVVLSWNIDDEPKVNKSIAWRHFNRFIYRVDTFERIYGSWFSVVNKNSVWEERVKEYGWEQLILNEMGDRKEVFKEIDKYAVESEHDIEQVFVKHKGKVLKKAIKDQFQIELGDVGNQYPVGVFNNKVNKENAIFTGGKSAIDLYANGKDGSFNIFELKAEGNHMVGIVSELFFYSSLIRDVIKKNNNFKTEKSELGNCEHVNAFFLVRRLHPLITDKVMLMLNLPDDSIIYRTVLYTVEDIQISTAK